MLNGYKSKPFNNCTKNDYVYKFIINTDYKSFWNSKYHNKSNIKFLENGYNPFNNSEKIQDLFEQMFEFSPMKRITANDIEHHSWFTNMNAHKKLQKQFRYTSELQHLYFENDSTKMQESDMKEKDSMESFYSKERTTHNSNNNILNIGYDSTQPSNESSLEISGYSTMMRQLKNHDNNIEENDNDDIVQRQGKSQVDKLLRKMSDNTSNFVKSQRTSMTNK